MANSYYTASGTPGTSAFGSSSAIRSEFDLIQSAFDKLPALSSGIANCAVVANGGGTGLTTTVGTLSLSAAFKTTGGFGTTLAEQAATTLTLPASSDTLVGRATTDTLSNKTFVAPALGVATGTSLALGGASLGGNAFAANGTSNFVGNVTMQSNLSLANGDVTTSSFGYTVIYGPSVTINSGGQFNIVNETAGVTLAVGGTAWASLSDERSKTDLIIIPERGALDRIARIRPVTYRYRTDDKEKRRVGLIAQDVEKIRPEAIDKNKDGYLTMRLPEFIPDLVAALKETRCRLMTLEGNACE